jgi:hypothetical protein
MVKICARQSLRDLPEAYSRGRGRISATHHIRPRRVRSQYRSGAAADAGAHGEVTLPQPQRQRIMVEDEATLYD